MPMLSYKHRKVVRDIYEKANLQYQARKKSEQNAKFKVFSHYSGEIIKCARCGFSDIRALSIDHINGGGEKHRKEIRRKSGSKFYFWIIAHNYPNYLQVLCMNCQFIKARENGEIQQPRNKTYGDSTIVRG